MKTLIVPDSGFDPYWDWVIEPYASRFIGGKYTHISDIDGTDLFEAEVVTFQDGTQGVCLGESVE